LIFLAIIFAGSQQKIYSQKTDSINNKKLAVAIVGTSAAYAATMIGLSEVWYSQYDKQSFHFFNDASEWKQVDKVGHFYSTFQLSSIQSEMLQWSSVSKRKSDLYGTLSGFVMISSIEILDGFSAGYGASATDLLANALGAGLYIGQQYMWNETRIYPKFSFHTTEFAAMRPNTLGSTTAQQIIKDYNGQTYWLSVDMDKFMRFPKWLNLAFGYGAENMIYAQDELNQEAGLTPYRQFYLAIDFDLTGIHSRSKFVNTLIYFANMIKLPAPTLEFSQQKVKGYAFYF
jgi:uncharacterized protein YfiM (DUF2279 family)